MKKMSRKEKRRLERLRRAGILFAIISVSAVLFVLFNTSFFKLDVIGVSGCEKTSEQDIVNASGFVYGENVLKANVKKAEQNIKNLPYIKDVEISRESKNKIAIKVVEREEDFSYYSGGKIFVCDSEGRVLKQVEATDVLPLVKGNEIADIKPGDNIFKNEDLAALKSILETAREVGELDKYKEIRFQKNNEFGMLREGNVKIDFGRAENVKYKFNFIVNAISNLKENNQEAELIKLNMDPAVIVPKAGDKEWAKNFLYHCW